MKAILPNTRARIRLEAAKEVEAIFERKCIDYDTAVLWNLHVSKGFGKERLRQYFDDYVSNVREIQDRYGDYAADKMRQELKKIGVDIMAWEKEVT